MNEIDIKTEEITKEENMNDNNSINDKDIREFGNNILYNSNSGEKIIFKENDNDNDDEKYIEKL